jgi:hypothetical protein
MIEFILQEAVLHDFDKLEVSKKCHNYDNERQA